MRKLLPVVLLLSGCTTISEMRDHSPRASYFSEQSPAALEHCLAGRLSWIAAPSIIRGEGETEIAFYGSGGANVLVSLRPESNGTRVQVRQLLAYGARVRGNVEMCVEGRS
jgi:hypothetical protein